MTKDAIARLTTPAPVQDADHIPPRPFTPATFGAAMLAAGALPPGALDVVPEPEPFDPDWMASAHAGAVLQNRCHAASVAGGWWHKVNPDGTRGEPLIRNIPEMLCLVHSEVSEAMEGYRKSRMDDHLPHRKAVEVELADAVIRIADLAGGLGLDLGGAIADKLAYNAKRADHKPAARAAEGGKAF